MAALLLPGWLVFCWCFLPQPTEVERGVSFFALVGGLLKMCQGEKWMFLSSSFFFVWGEVMYLNLFVDQHFKILS